MWGMGGFAKGAPMPADILTNAQRRSAVLARFEERLHDIWPDGVEPAGPGFASFDDLEAAATVTGDAIARELMEQEIKRAVALPETAIPERCDECGTKLKRVEVSKAVATIRGPVRMSRLWCQCRKCRKAFFPL